LSDPLRLFARLRRTPTVVAGVVILCAIALAGIAAPLLTTFDPAAINPASRNKTPGAVATIRADDGTKTEVRHWLFSVAIGLAIGLAAGYVRWVDGIVMRIMDGLMAIPAILLAIAVVSLSTAGLAAVIVAIVVPEVPRVVRLVRSVVLSAREEPYVEAAIAAGTPGPTLVLRHILPNTMPPLIVQATYIAASAMLIEAILSFLGVGIPPETPTWGNVMAEGRTLFRVYPHTILYPGIVLALTILSVNLLGDGLRDSLDPRMRRRL